MVTRQQLVKIATAAHYGPGEAVKPACAEVIDGHEYSVQYRLTNRKCYDMLPTPTAYYKIDGKRVPRAVFYKAGA